MPRPTFDYLRLLLLSPCLFGLASVGSGDDELAEDQSAAATVAKETEAVDADTSEPEAATMRYRFRYQYEPGEVIRYVVSDESVVEIEHASEGTTVEYSTKSWKHLKVRSVDEDGTAVLQVQLDRVRMSAKGADGKVEFDSREPGTPPPQFAHIINSLGRTLVDMTVAPTGKVTSLRKPGQREEKGRDISPAHLERDSHGPVTFPEDAVAIGDSWSERFDVPVLLEETRLTRNIKLQRTYTLTSVEKDVATFDVETIVLTPLSDPKLSAQLIQRTPSGIVQFDLKRGRVLAKRTFLHNQVVGHEGPGSKLKLVRTYVETIDSEDGSLTANASGTSAAR